MIEFKNVELHYHYDEYAVLKNLNFTLVDGVNTILCDSQSGKTSVCKLLTKQFKPTQGQILINGLDIDGIANKSLGILYMPSAPVFFEHRSVMYNVTYPLRARKASREEQTKRFEEAAKLTALTDTHVKLRKLSAAERKRVALARGLTVRRQIVLLDDFCSDSAQLDKLTELFGNGVTVVILTSDAALARGNVILLDGGVSVYQGDVDGALRVRDGLSWIVDMLRSE